MDAHKLEVGMNTDEKTCLWCSCGWKWENSEYGPAEWDLVAAQVKQHCASPTSART